MVNFIYQLLELFATFVEGAIVLSVSISLAGRKLNRKRNALYVLLLSVVYTVIITLMNNWQTFSFATLGVAIVFTFFAIFFVTIGDFIYKACATMMTFFFVNAADYIISYSIIMVLGKSLDISEGIPLILSSGPTRSAYILINKFLQIAIFVACRRLYPRLGEIRQKSVLLLLAATTMSYIVMSILTNMILSDSMITLQIAVIFSLFFIVLTIAATIISIAVSSRYESEKREKELMALTNTMMEKSFGELKTSQDLIRRQVHDFKNHLITIDGMLEYNSKAKEYTSALLLATYQQSQFCHSGNEIIDSIINSKMNEAFAKGIDFTHRVQLNSKLKISPVDICAILANQLDNALEACSKMSTDSERVIKVEIKQKESFVFFKVTNTTAENPFDDKGELLTTKDNSDSTHGFGIRNIRETAEKYNGSLKNDYANNTFISTVMISN